MDERLRKATRMMMKAHGIEVFDDHESDQFLFGIDRENNEIVVVRCLLEEDRFHDHCKEFVSTAEFERETALLMESMDDDLLDDLVEIRLDICHVITGAMKGRGFCRYVTNAKVGERIEDE